MNDFKKKKRFCRSLPLGRLFVSEERKYLWCSNPKCASTTIKQLIARTEKPALVDKGDLPVHGSGLLKDLCIRRFRPDFEKIYHIITADAYFKFVFVRNPFTRLVSAYENKIRRTIYRTDLWEKQPKSPVLRWLGKNPEDINQPVSFTEFVDFVLAHPPEESNPHWKPQHLVIQPQSIPYDFIGRMETFQQDLGVIKNRTGLFDTHDKVDHRKKTEYRQLYNLNP